MNRPIRFRAWNGSYMYENAIELGQFNPKQCLKFSEEFDGCKYTGAMEFMQFTGLLDKNGLIEVYEDDIIDEKGNVKGNIHEMDKGETDIVIPAITSEAWHATYKQVVARGLQHA